MQESKMPIDIEFDEITEIARQADAHRPIDDKLLKKIKKHLSDADIETMNALSLDELRIKIVVAQRGLADVQTSRELDEKLKRAKEYVAELEAPYAETRDRLNAITAYAVLRLRDIGK